MNSPIVIHDSVAQPAAPRPTSVAPSIHIDFTSVFWPNCIEMIRPASGKSSVISLLVQSLVCEGRVDRGQAENIIHGLMERERHGTSAIGKGLAFPHLRTACVDQFVGAIGVAPEGINFGALDDEPTKLVFLTLSPRSGREQHIHLLSRLVCLMQDKAVNMQLHHQLRPQDVYDYLADLDEQCRGTNLPA